MGYMRHHAIVVTTYESSWRPDDLEEYVDVAQWLAKSLGMAVSEVVVSPLNGYRSFFVAPDGSKEGWEDSAEGDRRRAEFIEWLERDPLGRGYSPYTWAEVQYGDEEGDNRLLRDSVHPNGEYILATLLARTFRAEDAIATVRAIAQDYIDVNTSALHQILHTLEPWATTKQEGH